MDETVKEKEQETVEQTEDDIQPNRKIPFKLCYTPKTLPGKSLIIPGRPLICAKLITPKFYTKTQKEFDIDLGPYMEKLEIKDPDQKYNYPKTQNQFYGWCYKRFGSMIHNDPRLHYPKRTDKLIFEHLMNYHKIR